MKNITLITAKNGLSFELVPKPVHYADLGPQIVVHDGDFRISSYCLSTFRENVAKKQGVCITAGKFEKYRAIQSDTLAELVAEADALLSGTPPTSQGAPTPGPWKVMPCPVHGGKHPLHDQRWIATAETQIEFGATPEDWRCETGSLICEMRDGEPANAALIAAAPELLAALAMFLDRIDRNNVPVPSYFAHAVDTARAAIAKATGGAK
jgi:hypothetical protein